MGSLKIRKGQKQDGNRVKKKGNEGILIFFLTKLPKDITIEAVIANHLLPMVYGRS
jgi:hypothetical protein